MMSPPIPAATLEGVVREARIAATRLAQSLHSPLHERDDLSHDLLVDLFSRLKYYDPRRGTLAAFAVTVIRHGVTRLAVRLRRNRCRYASVSLDDPVNGRAGTIFGDTVAEEDGCLAAWLGTPTNGIAALEDRLSLDRALNTLGPGHINLCAELVTGSIARIGGESGSSRATLYRQLHEVRLQLLAAGIGPRS